MKKFIQVLSLALVLSITLSSRPSHALIGAVAAPGIVTAGLITAGAGVGIFGWGVYDANFGDSCGDSKSFCLPGFGQMLLGLLVGGIGLVILEGEQTMAFTSLTAQHALELKLSQNELMSYNSEIDKVNAITHEIQGSVSTVEVSTKAWESLKEMVAPETFTAMVKIAAQK